MPCWAPTSPGTSRATGGWTEGAPGLLQRTLTQRTQFPAHPLMSSLPSTLESPSVRPGPVPLYRPGL